MPIARDIRFSGIRAIAAALVCLTLGACINVQTPVTQFSQAVTDTATAEDGLFSPATQRGNDLTELCLLSSPNVNVDPRTGTISSVDHACSTLTAQSDFQGAVDAVMQALKAYATALQSLVSDTAGTTFTTNVTALGNSVNSLSTSVAPLGVKGGLTSAQVSAVGKAVTDIGNGLLAFAISHDVKAAAGTMQQPLHDIAINMTTVNNNWAAGGIAANDSVAIAALVRLAWKQGSISDRQVIQTIVKNDFGPVTSDAVNKALVTLAAANDQIATAGPTVATTVAAIQSAGQAASDAMAAVKAFKGGK